MHAKRHVAAVVGCLLLVTALVAGCGGSSDDSNAGAVQLNLPDGRSVTIPDTPKRIITLGDQWTDIALAFGVTPVGYYDYTKSSTGKLQPWYDDKLDDSTFLDPTKGTDVGAVAKLDPDLIFAPGFAADDPLFQKISKLAPTVGSISGQEVDPWEDMVTVMGTVLHQPDKAKQIIDKTNSSVAAVAAEYPSLKGKTYSLAFMYGADQLSVFGDQNDGAAKLFTDLGMVIAPALAAQYRKTGQPRFGLSTENVPMLDSDLLVVATTNDRDTERLKGLAGYKNLKSVKTGAVAFLTQAQITGLNTPSPNSIVSTLDLLKPALAKAAAAS
ncbi:ABC transporter substrate-binding protein [Gordonia sp. NPDC003425]